MENSITLSFAYAIRQNILDALEWYRENIDKVGVKAVGEDVFKKGMKGYMRASEFSEDKCPKLASAQSLELVPRYFTTEQLDWFVDARYIAMKAKVAITEFNKGNVNWQVSTEAPMSSMALTCTTDILLRYYPPEDEAFGAGDWEAFPIEIKWTNGLKKYAIEQLIANMWVWRAPYGFVLTLPNQFGKHADVWVVQRNVDGWLIMPTVEQTRPEAVPMWYGDDWFQDVYDKRLAWEIHEAANLDGPGPFTNPFHPACVGSLVPYEFYKRNSPHGARGEPKPLSGQISELCPLYGKCHKARLEAKGIPTNPVPRVLQLDPNSVELEFKEWEDNAQ